MILSRDYLGYLCQQVVEQLAKGPIKVGSPELLLQRVKQAMTDEMTAEDRVNDEVRELLEKHAAEMRETGANYQEAFKLFKRQLLREKGVVPAAGDNAKVSRDKVIKLSHVIVDLMSDMKKEVELKVSKNDVRLEIFRILNELFRAESKIEERVRLKITSQKKQIVEGSQEWDILYRKYYSDELKKLGVQS